MKRYHIFIDYLVSQYYRNSIAVQGAYYGTKFLSDGQVVDFAGAAK
jgi:hypothetical protein